MRQMEREKILQEKFGHLQSEIKRLEGTTNGNGYYSNHNSEDAD